MEGVDLCTVTQMLNGHYDIFQTVENRAAQIRTQLEQDRELYTKQQSTWPVGEESRDQYSRRQLMLQPEVDEVDPTNTEVIRSQPTINKTITSGSEYDSDEDEEMPELEQVADIPNIQEQHQFRSESQLINIPLDIMGEIAPIITDNVAAFDLTFPFRTSQSFYMVQQIHHLRVSHSERLIGQTVNQIQPIEEEVDPNGNEVIQFANNNDIKRFIRYTNGSITTIERPNGQLLDLRTNLPFNRSDGPPFITKNHATRLVSQSS
jgi:hypothetical protein